MENKTPIELAIESFTVMSNIDSPHLSENENQHKKEFLQLVIKRLHFYLPIEKEMIEKVISDSWDAATGNSLHAPDKETFIHNYLNRAADPSKN